MYVGNWVLAAMLSVAGGVVPQARYWLSPSVDVPSSMWVLLLQPGATNSSGVIKLVVQTVQLLLQWQSDAETKAVAEDATPEDDKVYPPRRQLLAGGGSIGATGLQMSLA